MVLRRIEYLLFFFDIFGYNSGSSKLSRQRKISCFICVAHVLLMVFFTVYKIRVIFQLMLMPIIELLNSMFQYSIALYFYWFIVIDSISYTREHRNFWKTLKKINNSFSYRKKITFNRYLLKLAVYSSTTLWCTFAFTLLTGNVYEFMYIYFILMKICEIRVFYYIFCVEVTHNQMESIGAVLKENRNDKRFWLQSNGFQSTRNCYGHIYEMTKCLSKVFGFSQVTAILYCFYVTLSDINWMFTHVHGIPLTITISMLQFLFFQ